MKKNNIVTVNANAPATTFRDRVLGRLVEAARAVLQAQSGAAQLGAAPDSTAAQNRMRILDRIVNGERTLALMEDVSALARAGNWFWRQQWYAIRAAMFMPLRGTLLTRFEVRILTGMSWGSVQAIGSGAAVHSCVVGGRRYYDGAGLAAMLRQCYTGRPMPTVSDEEFLLAPKRGRYAVARSLGSDVHRLDTVVLTGAVPVLRFRDKDYAMLEADMRRHATPLADALRAALSVRESQEAQDQAAVSDPLQTLVGVGTRVQPMA